MNRRSFFAKTFAAIAALLVAQKPKSEWKRYVGHHYSDGRLISDPKLQFMVDRFAEQSGNLDTLGGIDPVT